MCGRIAPTTTGFESLRQRRAEPFRAHVAPRRGRASRRRAPAGTPGRNSRTYLSGGANSRPCQRSITVGLETPDARDHAAGRERGERLEAHREQPHRTRCHRNHAGADRDALRGNRDRGEQREDVGARDLAGDDGVVPAALGLARERHEALDGKPLLDRYRDADAHLGQRPSNDGGRRSRNAATPSLWSAGGTGGPSSRASRRARDPCPGSRTASPPNGDRRVGGDPAGDGDAPRRATRRAARRPGRSPISSAFSASMMSAGARASASSGVRSRRGPARGRARRSPTVASRNANVARSEAMTMSQGRMTSVPPP